MSGVILFALGWLFCGVISAGIDFAYFQNRYPTIAAKNYRQDLGEALLFGLVFGPIGLLINVFASGFCEHGWRLR